MMLLAGAASVCSARCVRMGVYADACDVLCPEWWAGSRPHLEAWRVVVATRRQAGAASAGAVPLAVVNASLPLGAQVCHSPPCTLYPPPPPPAAPLSSAAACPLCNHVLSGRMFRRPAAIECYARHGQQWQVHWGARAIQPALATMAARPPATRGGRGPRIAPALHGGRVQLSLLPADAEGPLTWPCFS